MIASHPPKRVASEELFPKAQRLLELVEHGYTVPPFLVILASEITGLYAAEGNTDDAKITTLAQAIIAKLPATSYAIRSAARGEDSQTHSNAGQFKTELDVAPEHVAQSLTSILRDASVASLVRSGAYSLIVQQYIAPDYAGVIFTRNPISGREMVIEHRSGSGSAVVGGESVERISFLYSETLDGKITLANIHELSTKARSIERLYDFPQDIEWAYKDGITYLLQTRPITSLTPRAWQGIMLAEAACAPHTRFYFEKTVLCETFNRPRPLSFSILKALHKAGGPILRAYAHFGITYHAHLELFKIVGNELFVNRNIETKTLFPALGHEKHNGEKPRWETMQGAYTTLKNMWKLAHISLKNHSAHAARLHELLSTPLKDDMPLKERFHTLMSWYEVIFEITICTQKAISKLEDMLGNDAKYLSELLMQHREQAPAHTPYTDIKTLRGNSLNIDDMSAFTPSEFLAENTLQDGTFSTWWNSVPGWKKVGLASHLHHARVYIELRESSRILSVRLIDHLRKAVDERGVEIFGPSSDLIYYATLEELMDETFSLESCEKRKREYTSYEECELPSYIASFIKHDFAEGNKGISAGVAEGVLVTRENLADVLGKKILYTEVLSPDLAQYFGAVSGIIAKNGGMLSHLAILARESHIPVVILGHGMAVPFGSHIKINGLTGEMEMDSRDAPYG